MRQPQSHGRPLRPGLTLLNSLGVPSCPLPACHTYSVNTSAGLVLIDPGLPDTAERVLQNIARHNPEDPTIRAAFLTHAHGDHSLAGPAMHKRGAELFASPLVAQLLQHDSVNAFRENPEYVRYWTDEYPPVKSVANGQILPFGDLEFMIFFTPGHSPGCISIGVVIDNARILFVGDLVFPDGSIGHVGARSFSATDAMQSLRTIIAWQPDILCGGHFYKPRRATAILENVLRRAEEKFKSTGTRDKESS